MKDSSATAGYDGPGEEPLKLPEDCLWELAIISVGSQEGEDTVYATFLLDGEPLGSLRLPSPEYVRYLRGLIYKEIKDKEPHDERVTELLESRHSTGNES